MKKFVMLMISVLSVFLLNVSYISSAEASRVAVLPIQVNDAIERAGDFNGYYWDIMIEKFKYPDYELMDDEKLATFVPEEGLKDFSKETLTELSNRTDAEIVVAMRLDEVKETPLFSRQEPTLETFMKGDFVAYNRLTGKYYYNKIYEKGEIEEVLTLRTDWQREVFSSELRRCVNRAIDSK